MPQFDKNTSRVAEVLQSSIDLMGETTDLDIFLGCYDVAQKALFDMIRINESFGVPMWPTPRESWESLKGSMPRSIDNFVVRTAAGIPVRDVDDIEKFLDNVLSCSVFRYYFKPYNYSRISNIRLVNYKTVKDIRQLRLAKGKHNMLITLGDFPQDFRCFENDEKDTLNLIDAIYDKITGLYNTVQHAGYPIYQSEKVLNEFKENMKHSTLPLAAQVRLEELLIEYEPKFKTPSDLSVVDQMDGHRFEHFCAETLLGNGFTDVSVTPGSSDQGVDVTAQKNGIKYAVQCKCYSSDLGNKPIQEVNTGKMIYKCHVGAVMTNRFFTDGAKTAANATGVLLWDRDQLYKMIQIANGNIDAAAKAGALAIPKKTPELFSLEPVSKFEEIAFSPNVKFCRRCGKAQPKENLFCAACGAKL